MKNTKAFICLKSALIPVLKWPNVVVIVFNMSIFFLQRLWLSTFKIKGFYVLNWSSAYKMRVIHWKYEERKTFHSKYPPFFNTHEMPWVMTCHQILGFIPSTLLVMWEWSVEIQIDMFWFLLFVNVGLFSFRKFVKGIISCQTKIFL